MNTFYITDFDLTPDQLEDKYSPDGDGEHPGYRARVWREAVIQSQTYSGYWRWVQHKLDEEQIELTNDSPYR